ncbi:MAG: IclR family transcriptional regulator [Pseudorhodoplanes sp.]|uniref:IclR family transcriptional regulator n=1 Tax=Pseudorhodoplanes sp. TaxID=1934341 RepID=UPI003D112811
MKPKSDAAVKSANRALDILEYVADATEPPTFSRLLADLGVPRSSLFHLLNNLLTRGYLEQDGSGGRYRLGQRVGKLAARLQGPTLTAIVLPHLQSLSDVLNETSGFNIWAGDSVEAVATATGRQALTFTMKVGERAPLYAVSSGKIVLSRMSNAELGAYLDRVDLQRITARTLQSKSAVRKQASAARQDGFAYSHEEFTPGITGISTAVTRDGHLLGTVNLAVPTARFTASQDAVFRRALRSAAAALSHALREEIVAGYALERDLPMPGQSGRKQAAPSN